ncbi:MAG: amidase domain-containing protein [Christensenellales bacterium]
MKRTVKRIQIAAIVLVLTVAFCTSVTAASSTSDGSEFDLILPEKQYAEIDYASVAAVLHDYFSEYYRSIEKLAISSKLMNYVVDNENTHLYLCALQYGINWRKAMATGIVDSSIKEIDLKYARLLPDGSIDIRAYVRVVYRHLDDETKTMAQNGDLWEIRIAKVDNTSKIVYLNSQSNDYYIAKQRIQEKMIKNAQTQGYTIIDAIDDVYNEINAFIPQLVMLADASNTATENKNIDHEVEKSTAEVRSVSVTYDYERARNFAHAKGTSYQTQIFKRVTNDCTNFVSQCLWVGYGGDQGNSWSTTEGIAACQQLALQNYRQISGSNNWFGRSYISAEDTPSGPWQRVKELYSYLSSSSSGPRASKYNNLSLYSSCSTTVRNGDILQFSDSASNNGYFHSVMVVRGGYSLSDASNIYVAQHSSEYSYRQLSELISSNTAPYVRIIRPITGSFNN